MTTTSGGSQRQEPFQVLLAKDYDHFQESFWRNEEVGEKRFSFFVTLVTAVTAGLVALASAEHPPSQEAMFKIVRASAAALLAFGLMTYMRMLLRNRGTDEYLATLARIRRNLAAGRSDYKVPVKFGPPWLKWFGGGYAGTVALVNGGLLAAVLAPLHVSWGHAAIGGAALVAALGTCSSILRAGWKKELEKEMPAAKTDGPAK